MGSSRHWDECTYRRNYLYFEQGAEKDINYNKTLFHEMNNNNNNMRKFWVLQQHSNDCEHRKSLSWQTCHIQLEKYEVGHNFYT